MTHSLWVEKRVVCVLWYKQEKFLWVICEQLLKDKSHVVLTKQRMHLRFTVFNTHQQSRVKGFWWSSRKERVVPVKLLHEVSQRKHWFPLRADRQRRDMLTCLWFVCFIWTNLRIREEGPPVTLSRLWAHTKNTFVFIVSSAITLSSWSIRLAINMLNLPPPLRSLLTHHYPSNHPTYFTDLVESPSFWSRPLRPAVIISKPACLCIAGRLLRKDIHI